MLCQLDTVILYIIAIEHDPIQVAKTCDLYISITLLLVAQLIGSNVENQDTCLRRVEILYYKNVRPSERIYMYGREAQASCATFKSWLLWVYVY